MRRENKKNKEVVGSNELVHHKLHEKGRNGHNYWS